MEISHCSNNKSVETFVAIDSTVCDELFIFCSLVSLFHSLYRCVHSRCLSSLFFSFYCLDFSDLAIDDEAIVCCIVYDFPSFNSIQIFVVVLPSFGCLHLFSSFNLLCICVLFRFHLPFRFELFFSYLQRYMETTWA